MSNLCFIAILMIAMCVCSVAYAATTVTYDDTFLWDYDDGVSGDVKVTIDAMSFNIIGGRSILTVNDIQNIWTINSFDFETKLISIASPPIAPSGSNWFSTTGNSFTISYATLPTEVRVQAHNPDRGWSYVWSGNYNFTANVGGYPITPDITKGDMGFDDPIPTAAVPEPGTILAACSILAPVGYIFRRRRA